jgi:hypothetical protein
MEVRTHNFIPQKHYLIKTALNKKQSPPISQLYIRRRNHHIHLRSSYDHIVHVTDGTKWKNTEESSVFVKFRQMLQKLLHEINIQRKDSSENILSRQEQQVFLFIKP